MKIAAVVALAIITGTVCSAHADSLQSAYATVSGVLQARGGGLAKLFASCPKSNNDEWQFVGSALLAPISETDSAVLLNTGFCNGGNGSGQYLVIYQRGVARLVTDAGIGDMSFLASRVFYFDGTLALYGSRWLPDDPHCCPSKKANLDFNLKTGSHKLTILDGDN
jgi:hypothetical protein